MIKLLSSFTKLVPNEGCLKLKLQTNILQWYRHKKKILAKTKGDSSVIEVLTSFHETLGLVLNRRNKKRWKELAKY